ncbi:MAG: carbohydrate kinase family protein [Niveispirillum sp.]|uniref:carbohydrate kinase family protein n=1 Tax=Niveispirillum sp. TaxID=1917217 RepID=UPI003BA68A93
MTKVVISGYATVDYVVHAAARFTGQGTVAMRTPPDGQWPRPGGAVLYAGRQLAAAGHGTWPLTWIGDDQDGACYRRAAVSAGMEPAGIAPVSDTSTTRCLMIYDPDGGHGCLLQVGKTILSDGQRALLAASDLLVLTAGPADATQTLLHGLPPAARLAWIVKPDSACFPPDLARNIGGRADWLFCNSSERGWLETYRQGGRSGQVVFETRGGDGVAVDAGGISALLPVAPLVVRDPTGAGDSFAGAALAALLDGAAPIEAARHGVAAAANLLRRRG